MVYGAGDMLDGISLGFLCVVLASGGTSGCTSRTPTMYHSDLSQSVHGRFLYEQKAYHEGWDALRYNISPRLPRRGAEPG